MTLITTRFDATTTADEVVEGVDLSGNPASNATTILQGLTSCDPIRRTPWGSIIAGEETTDGGIYEIMPLSHQLRTLITKLTDAVEAAVAAPRANIRVVLREVPATHWAAGDVTIAERRSADGG